MKAFILAAGLGTRLQPFTNTQPKALVPVAGVPLILYILAMLKHHRIHEVVINLHHHGAQIQKFLDNGRAFGFKISYSQEPKILGTGGGIKKALRFFDDDLLIINGDVIADFDLTAMIRQHQKNKPLSTLAVYNHPQKEEFGLLGYKNNQLLSILNQPLPATRVSTAMFGSYHILNKKKLRPQFANYKSGQVFCIMRHVYMPLLKQGAPFGAFRLKGFWHVCDSLDDVDRASQQIQKSVHKLSFHKELKSICVRMQLKNPPC